MEEPSIPQVQSPIHDQKSSIGTTTVNLQKATPQKTAVGADRAIYFLTRENPLRKFCIRVATSPLFDVVIIFAIIANSIILGLSDFSVVHTDLNPTSQGQSYVNGQLVNAFSMRNYIVENSELPFTSLFATECLIKIIALGFVHGRGTYLRDSWNKMDFMVVMCSLVSVVPGIPNVSVIRTIRVLRPLRSLSVIPGMRRLISALLKALPALANVLILQLFVFLIFGILGIQLFGGNMNRRCRLTEFPVRLEMNASTGVPLWPSSASYLQQVLVEPNRFKCLPDVPVLDDGDPNIDVYTKETSPWNKPQDCFWPIDTNDILLCAVPSVSGKHHCGTGRTCGADFDTYGNNRFRNRRVAESTLYQVELNWGYTNFDHIGHAFFTIFQAITQEGWTMIMYMVMDSSDPYVGAIFFVVLIIFASFFVMNLTLAVISEEFNLDDGDKVVAEVVTAPDPLALEQEQKKQARYPWLYAIVSHPIFSNFIMMVIVANTVALSLDHHPMPPELASNLEMINFALSSVFLVEMVMKLVGLGLRQYSVDKFNLFDAFVVTMSLLETIATPPSFMTNATAPKKGAVSALRSFRLFRVFKLARNWRSLRMLLGTIIRAVASIANFGVLLFLFIYIYALVGIQFFANTMRFDAGGYPIMTNDVTFWEGYLPRNNFDSLLWACVTVFQVITGENWNSIMYDVIRGNGFFASFYFISLLIMGDFILMNLFLALLLDNFSSTEDSELLEKADEMKKLTQKMTSMKVVPQHMVPTRKGHNDNGTTAELEYAKGNNKIVGGDDEVGDEAAKVVDLDQLTKELAEELSDTTRELNAQPKTRTTNTIGGEFSHKRTRSERDKSNRGSAHFSSVSKGDIEVGDNAKDQSDAVTFTIRKLPGRSLFLFSERSRIRQTAYTIITNPLFDSMILTLILISSVSLALDNPLANPKDLLPRSLKVLDTVFAVIFFFEMVLKIVALGVLLPRGAYLRNGWNVLDCIIVISSVMMILADSSGSGGQFKSLRSLRGLRTFRPLRMISRRPGLKLVVNALFEAIPAVANVLFVCMLFFLIFSIMAVNYLKGKFNHCSGDVFDQLSLDQKAFMTSPQLWNATTNAQRDWFKMNATCTGFLAAPIPPADGPPITSRYICECLGASWGPVIPQNFDNVGYAMLTLFEISTTEGWADVMMAAIDSTDIDMQPIRDNTEAWAYFFVVFMIVGSFFVVNLFIGVIIDNFNKMKASIGGDCLLTEEQKKWIEAQKAASRVAPIRKMKRSKHKYRGMAYDLVNKKRFEWFIMICIIVNTILMAVQYFGQPTKMITIINGINEVFAYVFTTEAVLKLIAYGRSYFDDPWNKFDLFVVCGTMGSIVVEVLTGTSVRSLAMLVRVFRVTRILRLVRASKSIRQILRTLYIALPGLSNITSILFLMLFIYATMGVQMFARVALGDNIDTHANFQDFGTAFLFLLRAATGEAWDSCMHDYASSSPGCDPDPVFNKTMCGFNNFEGCIPLNGCGNPVAYIYFCTFTLLITFVMLNLTIAVILEGFSLSHEDEEPLFEPELLEEFQNKWADIDSKATGFIHVRKLRMLITILDEPLGRESALMSKTAFFRYMTALLLPMYEEDTVHFKDVLLAMTREMVKDTVVGDPGAISSLPEPTEVTSRPRAEFSANQYFAVCAVQRSVKRWLFTKRQLEKQYMDEYRNKIKKPSGRPKKVRDARVYTIG